MIPLMLDPIAMIATLGLLVGCTRQTVVVSPEALPALAESPSVTYTRTKDGRQVVEQGPVHWVAVHSRPLQTSSEDTPHVEWYRTPFTAKLVGGELQMADEERQSRLPLRDIEQVEVVYDARVGSPAAAMRISGILLTSIAGATLVGGVTLVGLVAGSPHSNPDIVVAVGVPMLAASTVVAAIGIPLWVVGARRGAPAQAGLFTTVPTLAPTRNGAAVRWAF